MQNIKDFIKKDWSRLGSVLLLFLILIVVVCYCFIYSPSARVSQTMGGQIISSSPNSFEINDATFLQALIGQLISSNLGYLVAAITILVIIGGVFVYFNINPIKETLNEQEDKIDTLKKEAGELLKSSEDRIVISLNDFRKIQEEEVVEFLTESNKKNALETENQIAMIEKSLLERIESISESKSAKLKEIILSETENKISTTEKSINAKAVRLKTEFTEKISLIKTRIASLEEKVFDIQRILVDFEIENYLKKNQVGAMRKMIEKLEMDTKRGWGAEDTLPEIKEYIKNQSMPSFYFADLKRAIDKVPKEFTTIAVEILKLAEEKLYKVGQ